MKKKILIVEDQFIEANNLQMILEKSGYHVTGIARSVPVALEIIDMEMPDLVLLDIFLQGNLTGIDLAKKLNEKRIGFVYLSANSNQKTLDAAKVTKPYGFLVKPFRQKDILVTLDIAWYLHEQNLASGKLRQEIQQSPVDYAKIHEFKDIIGSSNARQKMLNAVLIVAPSDTSVLILGESGTGKEKVAECIHEMSSKKNGPLVKINCAALPATLIESELFGHEKGAFTGAHERRIGKFEQAKGGSIFLDEIGEMPLELQSKLLRVLQEKEIERIGGKDTVKIDARIIAATNKELEKEVAEGRFRMDLYYRLNVFPITIPPLRERKEDIPLLVMHFIHHFNRLIGKRISGISETAVQTLMGYDWPGNIRELENIIERSVLITTGSVIEEVLLPDAPVHSTTRIAVLIDTNIKSIEQNERDHIIATLNKTRGKISGEGGAAELLNVNVSTLNSKIKKLGIQKEHYFSIEKNK
jgi:two-component system, NtrC family, response regulator HydG